MENWIDLFIEFLMLSSALLLVLGVLSCLILCMFKTSGKARLIICSLLLILPAVYAVDTLIPDHHKVQLSSNKLQDIIPTKFESDINTTIFDINRFSWVKPALNVQDNPNPIEPTGIQASAPTLHETAPYALTWKQVLFSVWLALFVFILIRSFLSLLRIKRLIEYAERETDPSILKVYQNCLNETSLRRSPRLLAVDHMLTPMAVGFFRPAVILPARLREPEFREGLRFALLHELKHFKRGDNWWLLIESLVGAVYFFHPVIYWAKRRVHEEREHLCDRHVVQVTRKPAAYAHFLLHEIWNHGRQASFSSALIFKTQKTKRRVHHILGRMRPTLLGKILDRIAVSTAIACFTSLFVFTVTPSANVNREVLNPGNIEQRQYTAIDNVSPGRNFIKHSDSVIEKSDSTENNKVFQETEQEETYAETINQNLANPALSAEADAPEQTGKRIEMFEEADPLDDGKTPEASPEIVESPSIDTESQRSDMAESNNTLKKETAPSGIETKVEQINLLASLDMNALFFSQNTTQPAEDIGNGGSADPISSNSREDKVKDRASAAQQGETISENVSIPMGARITGWKAIDDRNIVISTKFYGSFKATLSKDYPGLSDSSIELRFVPSWPYELDINSRIILSNGDECRIQKLIPYDRRQNFVSIL